jgi:uncharacterized protein YfaQ (DUF2300 family)
LNTLATSGSARWPRWPALLLLWAASLAGASTLPVLPTRLAWQPQDGGAVQARERGQPGVASAQDWQTPLGSLWKLWVYAYLSEQPQTEPVYRCQAGQRLPDDDYCCDPGGSVGREQALARSCGPYFAPQHLGLSAARWRSHWQARQAPAWLLDLSALRPEQTLPVSQLLQALAVVPAPARLAAREALWPLSTRDEVLLAAWGSGPRFKTWSWEVQGRHAGGAAGWLLDGTPFWLGAPGSSAQALPASARWVAEQWAAVGQTTPAPDAALLSAEPCVEVAFFQRYPISAVWMADGRPAALGRLDGALRVAFRNGTQLPVQAGSVLLLRREGEQWRISARLPLEDYVARVVDREGQASEPAAARALAVAARSYVLQNATETEACRQIADDSRSQRVSPNPPTAAAQAAARFTHGLVLQGQGVRYHRDQAAPGVMAWRNAVQQGRQGWGFEAILRQAYPGATLGAAQAQADCSALPQASAWLLAQQQRWRARLQAQVGYEPLDASLQVCQLAMGTPHSDQRRRIIRVREWHSLEGRTSLIHEYLHLAFAQHPRGQDESFIETLAQGLAKL